MVVPSVVGLWLAAAPARAQVPDHLECFKVKDPQAKATYVANVDGLVAHAGCTIKAPAIMACVPAVKTITMGTPPGIGATGTPNAFGCYKLKCPKAALPPLPLDDQFGSRTVTPSPPKMICAPAPTTTTTTTTTTTIPCAYMPFTPVVQDAIDAFRLDASGDLNVAADCLASTPVCCTGGTPVSPCGPLQFDFTQQAGDPASTLAQSGDPNVYNATLWARVKTVNDIPVNVPVAGDCGMHIDTTAGAQPQIQLDFTVTFSADHVQMGPTGTFSISNLESSDVSLTGGIGCQIANLGISFFINTLTGVIADDLSFGTLCRCGTDLVTCGP
jgi:hypothetical protein